MAGMRRDPPTDGSLTTALDMHVVGGDGVILMSPWDERVLCGAAYRHVLPLLSSGTPPDTIVDRLDGVVDAPEVYYALMQLEGAGRQLDTGLPTTQSVLANVTDPPTRHTRTLPPVLMQVTGGLAESDCRRWLQDAGFATTSDADLLVVMVRHHLEPELERINREALASGRRWLVVRPFGSAAWVGPCFEPAHGHACWSCLASRLARNLPATAYRLRHQPPPTPQWRSHQQVAAQILGDLVTATGAADEPSLYIVAGHGNGSRVTRHAVATRPQCPACGDPDHYRVHLSGPVPLHPHAQRVRYGGGYRTVPPAVTLRRHASLVDPLLGVVQSVDAVDTDAECIHVFTARYAGRGSDALPDLRDATRKSGGKGTTPTEATASALFEAVERYSAVFQGDEPQIFGSYHDVADRAIHPRECLLFSERQYQSRDTWNRHHHPWRHVPVPFDEAAVIAWTPVWSLTRERQVLLPTAFLYTDHPTPPEQRFCPADSNGCAAGNTLDEAVLQGILELIERDAVATWWYNQIPRPAVEMEGGSDPYARAVLVQHRAEGRECWVLDITHDLEIPCCAAVSRRTGAGPERIMLGFGAHLDRSVAVRRALTEMNQLYAVRDEPHGLRVGAETRRWFREGRLADHPQLLPVPGSRTVVTPEPRLSGSLAADIAQCRRAVERAGLEVLVLDQTRPDVKIPVVKVVVPGLHHFWPRFGGPRLYDVPVQLGWLKEARREADLNPVAIFF